jgi:hypothetical protein
MLNAPLLLTINPVSLIYLYFVLAEALAVGIASSLLFYHAPICPEENSPEAIQAPQTIPPENPQPKQDPYEGLKKEMVVHESDNKN